MRGCHNRNVSKAFRSNSKIPPQHSNAVGGFPCGAAIQIRTGDPVLTKDVLYRLSYSSRNHLLLYTLLRRLSSHDVARQIDRTERMRYTATLIEKGADRLGTIRRPAKIGLWDKDMSFLKWDKPNPIILPFRALVNSERSLFTTSFVDRRDDSCNLHFVSPACSG